MKRKTGWNIKKAKVLIFKKTSPSLLNCSKYANVYLEQFVQEFIGRTQELQKLNDVSRLKRSVLVVIKGRRRIGKSRLAAEFGKDKIFVEFSGLPPLEKIDAQDERDAFTRQLAQQLRIPNVSVADWSDAFARLAQHLSTKPTVILFDEISWMASGDPAFVPKLKVFWDLTLQKFPHVMLILCGSVSTWIEENIINSTAFFGRITLQLSLDELSLPNCYKLLQTHGFKGSVYDAFKFLAVTGGVPWYLEQFVAHHTVDNNLKHLCFEKDGLLVHEFDRIFHDLFSTRGRTYKEIIYLLANGMRDLSEIRTALDYPKSGSLSDCMQALVTSGFVSMHQDWSLKSGTSGKRSSYRLSDNYLRFFVKYIEPNIPKINKDHFSILDLSALPGWEAMLGFQVENLLLKNRSLLIEAMGLSPADIVNDNPYFQRKTSRHKGCQIDYLVQTHTHNLFVCEFKFKKRELGGEIIEAVQQKIARFSTPRGYGVVPVLFHLSGVSDAVHDARYFYRIIDIADFLS